MDAPKRNAYKMFLLTITALLLFGSALANGDEPSHSMKLEEALKDIAELKSEVMRLKKETVAGSPVRRTAKTILDEINEEEARFATRRLAVDEGIVIEDETIIEPEFVSTHLLNASAITMNGLDLVKTIREFRTRITVLDEYLKTADVAHYYKFYFGMDMQDGGRNLDGREFTEMYMPYDVVSAEIDGTDFVFVAAQGDMYLNAFNASGANLDIGEEIPLVGSFHAGMSSNLAYFYPVGLDIKQIGNTWYMFVSDFSYEQIIILNVTNPSNIQYVSDIQDEDTGYDKLGNPYNIEVHSVEGQWVLAVASYSAASYGGNGVQLIDVTDPYNPSPLASIIDGTDGYTCLNNPHDVTMTEIGGKHYLFVAAYSDDCFQIADISEPDHPNAVSTYNDMQGDFSYLDAPISIENTHINGRTYILINAQADDTVVMVDVTNPYLPVEASSMSYYTTKSSTGEPFYGIGTGTGNDRGGMTTFKTTDVFGRINHFALIVGGGGPSGRGVMQLADISNPDTPIPVEYIEGSTSTAVEFYAMYYYPRDVTVLEMKGKHYAFVTSRYNSESTSYPNGLQCVKINPYKSW